MPTIKGPIHINGFNTANFMAEHAKDIKVKLPFSATGWKSEKMPKIADLSSLKLKADEKVTKVKETKESKVTKKEEVTKEKEDKKQIKR